MSTKTKKGIVAGILVVVMVVMLANAFTSKRPAQATPANPSPDTPTSADVPGPLTDAAAPATPGPNAEAAIQAALDLQAKRKALAWGRNPFLRKEDPAELRAQLARLAAKGAASQRTVSPPELTIKAIMWGSARPMAVINNKVLGEGDIAPDGSRVVRIARNVITVSKGGSQFRLELERATLRK